jgi:hypothetical protein
MAKAKKEVVDTCDQCHQPETLFKWGHNSYCKPCLEYARKQTKRMAEARQYSMERGGTVVMTEEQEKRDKEVLNI